MSTDEDKFIQAYNHGVWNGTFMGLSGGFILGVVFTILYVVAS